MPRASYYHIKSMGYLYSVVCNEHEYARLRGYENGRWKAKHHGPLASVSPRCSGRVQQVRQATHHF